MRSLQMLGLVFGLGALGVGCAGDTPFEPGKVKPDRSGAQDVSQDMEDIERQGLEGEFSEAPQCEGELISGAAVDQMLDLTAVSDHEDIYSTYDRIDGIATLFEACGDPWGLFPTTYRRITARGIEAIEDGDFEDEDWARRIIVDFASRYLANLEAALLGESPSWAWNHYYYLADRSDVSRTRAVLVAMVAHLTLDLPYSLVEIDTLEENEQDFFVFGEMMIEVADLFIADLRYHYDTDAEDILNGFFFGNWVDGAFGNNTMMTLSYQTIRAKSWNNRWYIEQGWMEWIAETEIYAAFWTIDGILATLDAAGTI